MQPAGGAEAPVRMRMFRAFLSASQTLLLSAGLLLTTGCLSNNNDDFLNQQAELQRQADKARIDDEATIQKYLTDNKITNYQKLPTGTYVVPDTTALGTGDLPKPGQTLSVLYTGTFFDGRVFDSATDPKAPFPFILGTQGIIQGWNDGFATLKKGSKATLLIPSARAYSVYRRGNIAPNTPLIFTVELLDIN